MSWESLLTPQEARLFPQLFQSVSKSQDGIVTGSEAVNFFASSGVPNEILSEIWEAADRDKVGYLTPETFAIALKLIACAQHGKEATEPILATTVPLAQFDGVVAPSPMISNKTNDIPITSAEREKYANIFKAHQPVNGIMDAETARNVFLKSKLPVDTLSQIWNLADVRQSGTLNQSEFIIAMHYIAKLMDGTMKTLPDKLPPVVFQSATAVETPSPLMSNIVSPSLTRQASMMTPPQRARTIDSLGSLAFGAPATQDWDVTAQEKKQFDTYFDKIDSNHMGYIQGKEAVEFFKNSKLPETELAHIWDLSDIQQRGSLSRDEFAVAMHLIHKRLRGEALPQTLPKTLVPPNQRQQSNVFASPIPAFASPSPVNAAVSPRVARNNSKDLLEDFGNDQIATETQQVNMLHNQISSFASHTTDLKDQKLSGKNVLEQLIQQKKELEAQMASVKIAHETVVKDLNEIQEQVRLEEAEWDKIRAEYNAAQQELVTIQNETARISQTLENGRAETESLKRHISEIQKETQKTNAELDKLRTQSKQQSMMLDINRRQVTAAEQDRSLAARNLEDYKAAAGLTAEDDDSEDDDSEDDDEDDSDDESQEEEEEEEGKEKVDAAVGPQSTSSAVNTPTLGTLFGSPSASTPNNHIASPFGESAQIESNTFESSESAVTTSNQNEFDAIFGTMSISTPASSTPVNAFDPIQWPTSPTSTATKSSRGPPPPPPQSKHYRQPSISSVASSTAGIKKQRAPPPPPPSAANPHEKVKDNKDEDDFEAAFSGNQLPEVKIVAKDDDFADFDDAFSSFDTNKANNNIKTTGNMEDEWTSAFVAFDAPKQTEQKKPEILKSSDDWDSIFGVSTTPTNKVVSPASQTSGFGDSFSSFAGDFGKQKSPKMKSVTTPSGPTGAVDDKIKNLVKMGFGEREAKDALNRYDQDLEKASNFLLDQTK
ncbi:hypothetical protein G6F62_004705 [Rhizopus arrhizus]|uniref:Uncharacterized protein n=1 Tax=Rhizopus oryzae TaxID=64495 RepID=A0A9P7BW91_RHIOR|nr:hypothetical protein G6F23_009340 [Rhizopus arrhizus]KAG0784222.1 hypothetical protein G6F21_010041 [Rhizopus arrhizus]KAG0798520.1 hypothetical protein G6F22_004142 [Rhizopus arrhizus]KAG0810483.1 hypothetical protein G6F20_007926 [Rhizopus arrhizus]KAG0825286.1 hypothetical protein G6F18_010466 [Rhizopus arrhizus]